MAQPQQFSSPRLRNQNSTNLVNQILQNPETQHLNNEVQNAFTKYLASKLQIEEINRLKTEEQSA